MAQPGTGPGGHHSRLAGEPRCEPAERGPHHHAGLPRLRAGGTIINASSVGAEYTSTSYGTAKAAVAAWTGWLSAEVGPKGLTANVISPGHIAGTGFFRDRMTEQRQAALIGATHDDRAGQPGNVAATAYFLASDGARHTTGQVLHVNGGAHTTR